MDIISGEKIQFLCDIYICKDGEHIKPYNPNVDIKKCVSIKHIKYEDLINKNYIFIYPHIILDNYNQLLSVLCKKKENFIIVTHNSDKNINNIFDEIFKKTKCKKVFCQNLNISSNDKYNYLPIGIANSQWKHGNIKLLNKIININYKKENKIFFNFTINTNYNKRNYCYNQLKNKIHFSKKTYQEKYLQEIASSKFCICPEGNGLDTHRLWECLYLKTIPICVDSIFIRNIYVDFPIMIINDWSELEISKTLYDNYNKYINALNNEKLQFTYWKKQILNT